MTINDIIAKKRDKQELSESEIKFIMGKIISGDIPDYQLSAFLMAGYLNRMTQRESELMAYAITDINDTSTLSKPNEFMAEIHTIGQTSDSSALIVLPTLAALGCKLALNCTGILSNTQDKLKCIPGLRYDIAKSRLFKQINDIGMAFIGESSAFSSIDNILSTMYNAKSSIEFMPLLTSCIIGNIITSSSYFIVLNVKFGTGSYISDFESARKLGQTAVEIGKKYGKSVHTIITGSEQLIGSKYGTILELTEIIEILKGAGSDELREVCIGISALLLSSLKQISIRAATELAAESLASGAAYKKFTECIAYQGGDVRFVSTPELFGISNVIAEIKSESDGYLYSIDTRVVNRAVSNLHTEISSGIILNQRIGSFISCGDTIAHIRTSSLENAAHILKSFKNAFNISEKKPPEHKLIQTILA